MEFVINDVYDGKPLIIWTEEQLTNSEGELLKKLLENIPKCFVVSSIDNKRLFFQDCARVISMMDRDVLVEISNQKPLIFLSKIIVGLKAEESLNEKTEELLYHLKNNEPKIYYLHDPTCLFQMLCKKKNTVSTKSVSSARYILKHFSELSINHIVSNWTAYPNFIHLTLL